MSESFYNRRMFNMLTYFIYVFSRQVSITLPVITDPDLFYTYVDVQGYRYYAGETFNITLDRLQIFQLDVLNGFDLTGMSSYCFPHIFLS